MISTCSFFFFFLNDPAPPKTYPLPLHAALPIYIEAFLEQQLGSCSPAETGADNGDSRGLRHSFLLAGMLKARRGNRCFGASLQGENCVSRSEEHTSELQSQSNLVCRLLLEKKKK